MHRQTIHRAISLALALIVTLGIIGIPPAFAVDTWGPWSGWSSTNVSPTSDRQVETRTATVGYNMVVYVTQEAAAPYNRNFRSYSVNGNYSAYGLRSNYGEFRYTRYATTAELNAAPRYNEGDYIGQDASHVGGYQRGRGQSYYFPDGYGWFPESENRATEYRYRDLIKAVTYTVTFCGWTGKAIKIQTVEQGQSASPPEVPYRVSDTFADYTFTGWDKSYSNVQSDIMVYALYAESTKPGFTVTFCDWDGRTLKTQTLEQGQSATPPETPHREGYTFVGWDKSYAHVQSNIAVYAQYTENAKPGFTVTFRDWDGATLKTQAVEQGGSATPPANPAREGYAFTGWDVSYSNVQSNLTVTAQYAQNAKKQYTVTFRDWNGNTLKTQAVEQGGSATPPANPYREGYTFTGWNISYSNVQSNLTVTAQYTQNSISDPFTMGEDNYRFANTWGSFGYDLSYRIPLERYEELFTPTAARSYYSSAGVWGGNCYGFAASSYALEDYKLNHSVYQSGVNKTYSFSTPGSPSKPITKLIELYQISQYMRNNSEAAKELSRNYDKLSALASAVNNEDGLIVCLWGGGGGHAVIAYDIEKLGGTKYAIKIYDNNQPENKNLRIEIDTSKSGRTGWAFNSADTQQYNSRLHDNISFVSGPAIYNDIEKAKQTKYAGNAIQILAPADAEITNGNGRNVEDVPNAYKFIPIGVLPLDENGNDPTPNRDVDLWFVPEDVYTIDIPKGMSSSASIFNDNEIFEITADNGGAVVECTVGDESYAKVLEADANSSVEIGYATNETIDEPAKIRTENGGTISTIAGEDGKLIVVGNIEITIISGAQNVEIADRAVKTITLQIGSPYMYVDGARKEIYREEPDVTAILRDDRTLVPIRAIAEELGCTVNWDNETRATIIERDGTKIMLRINDNSVDVNGKKIQSDVAPQLIRGHTMIPLRIVAEALHCQVEWNKDSKTVIITG
jgi:hypothetical protein